MEAAAGLCPRVKLLLDEMYSPRIAQQLRMRGHDVDAVAARENLRTRPDPVIFASAQVETRAVVTENIPDFRRWGRTRIQTSRSHAGLIFTQNARFPRGHPRTPGRLVTALDELLTSGIDLTNREYWLA